MKKALLASTALVGAALLSAPAQAGTPSVGDNLEVRLSGFIWFQASWLSEDNSTGYGRGHRFKIPESEFHINASNTADNGIKYGVSLELETNTDASNNSDEAWVFIDSDFGRVELGDQDDATNRMLVGAFQAHQGISGPFGGLGGLAPVFHLAQPAFLSRTDWQVVTSSDATKVIYFSPRFSGFQAGVSYTADLGQNGANFLERDDDGDYNNGIGAGVNYTGKFGDFGVSVSGLYEHAEGGSNVAVGAGNPLYTQSENKDLNIWYVGAKVDYAGFTVGANYRDNGKGDPQRKSGTDAGYYWAAAVGYSAGPWGISGWYSYGEADLGGSTDEKVTRIGVGGRYAIAPGWQIRGDWNYIEHKNIGASSSPTTKANSKNDANAFILTNMFNF